MGFSILDHLSQADIFYAVAVFSRSGEPQIKVSVFPRSVSIFWKATLPQKALKDAWEQSNLTLVFAECAPVVIENQYLRRKSLQPFKPFSSLLSVALAAT